MRCNVIRPVLMRGPRGGTYALRNGRKEYYFEDPVTFQWVRRAEGIVLDKKRMPRARSRGWSAAAIVVCRTRAGS